MQDTLLNLTHLQIRESVPFIAAVGGDGLARRMNIPLNLCDE